MFLMTAILTDVIPIVVICISLIISDVEHLCTCLLAILSVEKYLGLLLILFIFFFQLNCMLSWHWAVWAVYILDIKSLDSHIVCKYFLLFFSMVSFAVQKLLNSICLSLLLFFYFCFRELIQEILLWFMYKRFAYILFWEFYRLPYWLR